MAWAATWDEERKWAFPFVWARGGHEELGSGPIKSWCLAAAKLSLCMEVCWQKILGCYVQAQLTPLLKNVGCQR